MIQTDEHDSLFPASSCLSDGEGSGSDDLGVKLIPAAQYNGNPIMGYVKKYIIDNAGIEQKISDREITIKYLLKFIATIVGAVAGLPWIKAGEDAGQFIKSPFVSFMAAYGGLLTYGLTSIWAFHEVLTLLDKKTEEEKLIYDRHKVTRRIKIATCQVIGILSSLPTGYTANKYNTQKLFILIACAVSYAFNSLGMYKLINIVLSLKNRTKKSKRKIFVKCLEKKMQLICMQHENANQFHQFIMAESDNISIILQKNQKDFFRCVCLFIFPLSNFIFNSVLTYRGLKEIGLPSIWSIILNPLVTLPLYGLDLFSTNRAVDITKQGYRTITCQNRLKQKGMPIWRYLIIGVAFFISVFSASPGAYIAYDQMHNTFFGRIAIFFGVNFWLLRITLETNAINEVVLKTTNFLGGIFNPQYTSALPSMGKIKRLRNMVAEASDNEYEEYLQLVPNN